MKILLIGASGFIGTYIFKQLHEQGISCCAFDINQPSTIIEAYTNSDNWIIGDTGMDISVGKKLGIKTVAVLSGFQNLAVLSAYKPDYILKNIKEFDPSNKIDFK